MELTTREWQAVEAIAQELTGRGVDRNELGKVVTYFRLRRDKASFLELLTRLPNSDYIRSGRTRDYFRRIQRTCERRLRGMDDERALVMVSWAFRMMTFYKFQSEKRAFSKRRPR